jgi:hypothetical protein
VAHVKGGAPISRYWFVLMHNGIRAVDWGEGRFLDLQTGTFFHAEDKDVSHRAQDADLEWLKHNGQVDDYDAENVYLSNLPDLPRRMIE